MKKIYILDTNVLIHDPKAIFSFEENKVLIPIYVLEEIDKLKKEASEIGRAARTVARQIDNMRQYGRIFNWIKMENGGEFKIEINGDVALLPDALKKDVMDNRILAVAKYVTDMYPEDDVILVSKDINMRIKGDSLHISVEDYETDKVEMSELYSGDMTVLVEDEKFKEINKTGYFKFSDILKEEPYPNQFVTIVNKKIIKN